MKLSDAGAAMIKSFEGCKLNAYLDIVGVPTLGYGHTGPDVVMPMSITQDEADALFLKDIARFENGVSFLVPDIAQCQFDALVSFAYNLGLHALGSSTLLRMLLAGNPEGAADQFLLWNKAGGKPVDGLTRRRQAERAMFLGQTI